MMTPTGITLGCMIGLVVMLYEPLLRIMPQPEKHGLSVRVCEKKNITKSVRLSDLGCSLNKMIALFALIRYQIIIANSIKCAFCWLSTISAHIQYALKEQLLITSLSV